MEPKKVGRALGIGVRVASKMVQQRMAASAPPAQASAALPFRQPSAAARTRPTETGGPGSARPTQDGRVRAAGRPGAAKQGVKAFAKAFLGPFTHAGSILWLEITGLFFGLFTLFFVQSVYRTRGSWRSGADHMHFLLYVALAAGFAWFSGSSFVRARRKSRRGPVSR